MERTGRTNGNSAMECHQGRKPRSQAVVGVSKEEFPNAKNAKKSAGTSSHHSRKPTSGEGGHLGKDDTAGNILPVSQNGCVNDMMEQTRQKRDIHGRSRSSHSPPKSEDAKTCQYHYHRVTNDYLPPLMDKKSSSHREEDDDSYLPYDEYDYDDYDSDLCDEIIALNEMCDSHGPSSDNNDVDDHDAETNDQQAADHNLVEEPSPASCPGEQRMLPARDSCFRLSNESHLTCSPKVSRHTILEQDLEEEEQLDYDDDLELSDGEHQEESNIDNDKAGSPLEEEEDSQADSSDSDSDSGDSTCSSSSSGSFTCSTCTTGSSSSESSSSEEDDETWPRSKTPSTKVKQWKEYPRKAEHGKELSVEEKQRKKQWKKKTHRKKQGQELALEKDSGKELYHKKEQRKDEGLGKELAIRQDLRKERGKEMARKEELEKKRGKELAHKEELKKQLARMEELGKELAHMEKEQELAHMEEKEEELAHTEEKDGELACMEKKEELAHMEEKELAHMEEKEEELAHTEEKDGELACMEKKEELAHMEEKELAHMEKEELAHMEEKDGELACMEKKAHMEEKELAHMEKEELAHIEEKDMACKSKSVKELAPKEKQGRELALKDECGKELEWTRSGSMATSEEAKTSTELTKACHCEDEVITKMVEVNNSTSRTDLKTEPSDIKKCNHTASDKQKSNATVNGEGSRASPVVAVMVSQSGNTSDIGGKELKLDVVDICKTDENANSKDTARDSTPCIEAAVPSMPQLPQFGVIPLQEIDLENSHLIPPEINTNIKKVPIKLTLKSKIKVRKQPAPNKPKSDVNDTCTSDGKYDSSKLSAESEASLKYGQWVSCPEDVKDLPTQSSLESTVPKKDPEAEETDDPSVHRKRSRSRSRGRRNGHESSKSRKERTSDRRSHRDRSRSRTRSRSQDRKRRRSRSNSQNKNSDTTINRRSRERNQDARNRRSRSRSQGRHSARSRSREKRTARSRSRDRRTARSRSKEKQRARSRSKERQNARSRSREKQSARSRSREGRNARSRSREKRCARSRSRERRNARSRSREKQSARSRSRERRNARSRSRERRYARSRSRERRNARSRSRERRNARGRSRERRKPRSRSRDRRTARSRSRDLYRARSRSREHRGTDQDRNGNGSRHDHNRRHSPTDDTAESANAGYCFVEFPDSDSAQRAMLRLNGKVIPGTVPPKRFKLNYATHGGPRSTPEYSIYVGDLTDEVDDLALYTAFSRKYNSCISAKVVLNNEGLTKGYGFVRFTSEDDQRRARIEMQDYRGLGGKALRVAMAAPKNRRDQQQGAPPQQQQYYYDQYQHYYNLSNQWLNAYSSIYPNQYGPTSVPGDDESAAQSEQQPTTGTPDTDDELEDPMIEIDVEEANKEFMERSEELYNALEGSRWHPLDNIMSTITGGKVDS